MKTSFHVQRAIRGDPAAAQWLVERFQPLVTAQVRIRLGTRATAHDVEDVLQEVWMVVIRRIADLRPRAGRLAPVMVRFLGTTALNKCNSLLRRRIRSREREERQRPGEQPSMDDLELRTRGLVTKVMRREAVSSVRASLESLSEDKRRVLALRLLEGLTNQQIATALGTEPNTVAVRYRRALQELRDRLSKSEFADFAELWSERR